MSPTPWGLTLVRSLSTLPKPPPLLAKPPSISPFTQPRRRQLYHPPLHNASSVDPSEISHFKSLASSWWEPYGPSRLLHLMNPLRHDFIARCRTSVLRLDTSPPSCSPSPSTSYSTCHENVSTTKNLDVGCGGGIFSESLARLPSSAHVLGIDPSPHLVAVARDHASKDPFLVDKLEYEETTIETLAQRPEQEGRYDLVSIFEVLEHVSSPSKFLESAAPLLKPGGWLVGSTIARTWTSWFVTKLMAEHVLRIVPEGTHEWNKYTNEDEMRNHFARQSGWGDLITMGVVYFPGLGWEEVQGSEKYGNYFFGIRKLPVAHED